MEVEYKSTSSLGEFIRYHRKRIGLSQEELAKKISLSGAGIIRKYEKDDSIPSADNLASLADTFSVSLDELYYGKKSDQHFDQKFYLELLGEAENFPQDEKKIVHELISKFSIYLELSKVMPKLLERHKTVKS